MRAKAVDYIESVSIFYPGYLGYLFLCLLLTRTTNRFLDEFLEEAQCLDNGQYDADAGCHEHLKTLSVIVTMNGEGDNGPR